MGKIRHHNIPTPRENFYARIKEVENGCWEWQSSRMRSRMPYGVYSTHHSGKRVSGLAHRLSWELHRGPIPDGMFVCHKCDNPPCVNPDHLFLGTARDNMRDMVSKGRNSKHMRGEGNLKAKLNEFDARNIRFLFDEIDMPVDLLAAEYGVTIGTIYHIAARRTWKHVQ